MDIDKIDRVINSCTNINQLPMAGSYADAFIRKHFILGVYATAAHSEINRKLFNKLIELQHYHHTETQ